jgi:hypothetical protein
MVVQEDSVQHQHRHHTQEDADEQSPTQGDALQQVQHVLNYLLFRLSEWR